jgi:carboxyl-terminal processing protease
MKKLIISFLLLASITFAAKAQPDRQKEQIEFQKIGSVVDLIDNYYMDSVKTNELLEKALVNMLENLDPHSVYVPKSDVEASNEPLVGNFDGIGIQFNILKDTVLVAGVIPGGPSEKVGIMPGDKIIFVNDTNIAGIKIANNDVMHKLRGPKGTKVRVDILRKGEKKLLDFVITRDKIPLYSVDASYMVDDNIGYIKLNKFSATTEEEMHDAIKKLKDQGMKSLILDLEYNGGGYLNAAVGLADEFLSKDKLIVYTQGIHAPKQVFNATSEGLWETGNLVVLINENSASASEIVSGAIQDQDRGLIIGRNSFGKGLVQKQFGLGDGSQVRLTIAQYFTPSGRCIQRPYDKGKKDYYNEFERRYKSGAMMYMDSIHLPDSLQFNTLNTQRKVYGGGGILPDIFVGIDTSEISDYYSSVFRKGVLNTFTLKYLDANRKELLAKYPNVKVFKAQFVIDKKLQDDFTKACEDEGVKFDKDGFKRSERIIKLNLKGLIARSLYEAGDYYYITNELQPSYNKAVQVLRDGTIKKFKVDAY